MPVARDVFDRLFEKTAVQDNGCWDFTGHLNAYGYGTIAFNNRSVLAHRMAYILCVDDIPTDMNVLHTCDNPACVNPEHLFIGTQIDNIIDMTTKGRNFIPSGINNPKAKLTVSDIMEIRKLLANGITQTVIANQFNMCKQTISEIARGNLWKGVGMANGLAR